MEGVDGHGSQAAIACLCKIDAFDFPFLSDRF